MRFPTKLVNRPVEIPVGRDGEPTWYRIGAALMRRQNCGSARSINGMVHAMLKERWYR